MTIDSGYIPKVFSKNASLEYDFGFEVVDASSLKVTEQYVTGPVAAELGVDYTVELSSNAGETINTGGTVTFTRPHPAGATGVVIGRDTEQTQLVDYQPYGPFPAETHEFALDKITLILQEHNFGIKLALAALEDADNNNDCGNFIPVGGTADGKPITGALRFTTNGAKDWTLTQISDLFGGNAITFAATGANSGMYVATIDVDGAQHNFAFEPDGDFTVPRTLNAAGVVANEGGLGAINLTPTGRSLEVGDFGIIVPSEYDADKVVVEDAEGDVEITRTLTADGLAATTAVSAGNLPTKGKLLEVGDFGIITQSAFSADDLTGGGGDGPLPSGSVKDTLVCAGDALWVSTSLMQIDDADTKVTVNGELIADGIISNAGIGSVVFTDTGRNVEVGPFGLLQQSAFDAADIITKDAEGDVEIPRTLTASAVAALDGGLAASNLTVKGKALEVGDFGVIVPSAYNAADVVYADEDGDVAIGRTLTADGVFATSGGLGAANLTPKGRALQVGDFGIIEPASYAADKVVFEDSEGDVTIGRTLTADALAATNGGVGASNLTVKGRLLQVGDFGIIEQSSVTAGDIGGVPESRTISSGSGLNGGGDLSQNRTLTVDNTVLRTSGDQTTSGSMTATGFAASSGSFGSVQFTTKGRLLQVGDFGIIEQASVSASDIGGVPESRTISSGTGLSGGGNLSANRTLSVDSSVIRNTGTQSVGGSKTFTSKLHASNSMKVGTTLTEPTANSLTVGGKIASEGMPAGSGPYLVNTFGIISYLSSDARLKKDVVDGTMGIDTIMKMRPVEFTWNEKTQMEGMKDIGFIAQEQKAISHHLVCEDLEWMTLKSENLNPILVKALQQQQEVIENLTARIEKLEAEK